MGRVDAGGSRGCPEPLWVTGSFPARGDPARAFPPRTPPGYLFSGDGGSPRFTRLEQSVFLLPGMGCTATVARERNSTLRDSMRYTLGQAAKAVGKSKSTLSRAIKKGKISAEHDAHGQFAIDPAELHRVYPATEQGNDCAANDTSHHATPSNGIMQRVEIAALERENALLREMLGREKEISRGLEQDRDHWRQQATTLLTDQRGTAPQKPVEGRWARAWGIWRGKA